jgi:hypothetical protein
MIEHIKRWFGANAGRLDLLSMAQWSRQYGAHLRPASSGEGFTIEGLAERRPWRLDWGPSQRSYMPGQELLMRVELGLPSDLQMLLMNRSLAASLEAVAFEQCMQTMQTVVDFSAPEEVRWLSMFPKARLCPDLAERYEAWSCAPSLASWWIEGPLSSALQELAYRHLPEHIPFLLMTLRGRLYLRCQLPVPTPEVLEPLRGVFTLAAEQAVRMAGGDANEASAPGEWSSSTISGLLTQLTSKGTGESRRPNHPPA